MVMASYYPIAHSPRRLSERRGIPELQPLEPAASSKAVAASRVSLDTELCRPVSQGSSVVSTAYSYDACNNTAMLTPITPIDISPFRSDVMSPITAPPSIQEEDEDEEAGDYLYSCNCAKTPNGSGARGLGFELPADGAHKQTMARSLTERLHVATGSSPSLDHDYLVNRFENSNIGTSGFLLPPTPPSRGEVDYGFPGSGSPILRSWKSGELVIDPECFSSDPPSMPQSPASDSGPSRSRAGSILNKLVSPKLRATLKRRMSSSNSAQNQIPSVPSVSTMPKGWSPTGTSLEDGFDAFFCNDDASLERAAVPDDSMSMHSAAEAEAPLPPLLHPAATIVGEGDPISPLQSPRIVGPPGLPIADVFPEMSNSPIPSELISSPLHPPKVSPFMSPSLASASQVSLSVPATPLTHHKKVPSIDPATPLAPKKLSIPITLVTANSLADMIEEKNRDLNAYDMTLTRMRESGWSSAQEIRNVELQREDKERIWQKRIDESKKILEGMRRYEVKHSAMSSMSSIESYPTTCSNPISPTIPVTDTQSLKGLEHTLAR